MRSRRGQATVELALMSVVFITVLLFGIHFAEVGWLSIKVQEAANSALWDTTAQQMHDTFSGNWKQYRDARQWSEARNTIRYEDLDGRASQERGPAQISTKNFAQVFTVADRIEVFCEQARLGGFSAADLQDALVARPMRPVDAAIPYENTATSCHAAALMRGYRMPQFFLENDDDGFFNKQHWAERDMPICSAGRFSPRTGKCRKAFTLALDDWGFSGPQERLECHLAKNGSSGCQNRGYFNLVNRSYEAQMNRAGPGMGDHSSYELAAMVMGNSTRPPMSAGNRENHFYLSFRGSESSYLEDRATPSHQHSGSWETTPWSGQSKRGPQEYKDARRDNCWLGHRCR